MFIICSFFCIHSASLSASTKLSCDGFMVNSFELIIITHSLFKQNLRLYSICLMDDPNEFIMQYPCHCGIAILNKSPGTNGVFVDMIFYLLNLILSIRGEMARIKIKIINPNVLINCFTQENNC